MKRAHVHVCPQCDCRMGCSVVHDLNRANERVEELGAALLRYAVHEDHCTNPPSFCDCGLADLLGEVEDEKR